MGLCKNLTAKIIFDRRYICFASYSMPRASLRLNGNLLLARLNKMYEMKSLTPYRENTK